MQDLLCTTTSNIEGRKISRYLGVVSGHAILGMNAVRDMFANVRDMTGGHVKSYEKELVKARDVATDMMENYAKAMGANAVIGIDMDFETMGKENGILMVVVSGTAIIYQ